jgi:N-acetyl-gamma-glutamyl-phosphate reductase
MAASRLTRIAIIGGSGYTGLELIRLILAHPDLELSYVTSERLAGKRIRECFPFLPSSLDLEYQSLDARAAISSADVFFLALPSGVSLSLTPLLRREGKIVIDLSADYRFKDLKTYRQVYGKSHTDEALAAQAVYGLPERYRQKIRASSLIANPGCYATSIILGLLPCLHADLAAHGSPIIADSKSGISGAGRKLEATYLFTECDQNVKPYHIGKHRHVPEIEQELNLVGRYTDKSSGKFAGSDAGEFTGNAADESTDNAVGASTGKSNSESSGRPTVSVLFTPQLVPVRRGILSNIYVPLRQNPPPVEKIWEIYHRFYQDEPFTVVAPLGSIPCLKDVYLSNYCRLGLVLDQRTNMLVIVSVLDNLVKGASGQAIQNLNIILGLNERAGLEAPVPYP